jgi:hypothetical protein
MKSSGSNCLVADDVFVPEHPVMLVPPAIVGQYGTEHGGDEALYRSALVPALALVLIGPQPGMGGSGGTRPPPPATPSSPRRSATRSTAGRCSASRTTSPRLSDRPRFNRILL